MAHILPNIARVKTVKEIGRKPKLFKIFLETSTPPIIVPTKMKINVPMLVKEFAASRSFGLCDTGR